MSENPSMLHILFFEMPIISSPGKAKQALLYWTTLKHFQNCGLKTFRYLYMTSIDENGY